MKRTFVMLATMGLVATGLFSPAFAAGAPTAAQKSEFYAECVKRGSEELCSCKADAAMKLIDESFMAVVLDAIKGVKYPADSQAVAYGTYISKSNAICIPGY